MAPRNRTISYPRSKGTARNDSGTINIGGGTINAGVSTCSDQTGPGDCAPFTVNKWYFDGGVMNKTNPGGGGFFGYTADVFNVNTNFPHGTVSGLQLDETYAVQAAARSNPSKPYVDIPVNILELGDVVRLIRTQGRGIIFNHNRRRPPRVSDHARNVGNTNLLYQFGLAPLVGDLVKLLDFQEQLDKRLEVIKRLQGPKGYRRTMSLDSGSVSGVTTKSCQSNLATLSSSFNWRTTVEVRAHVRWRADPAHDLPRSGSDEMRALARNAVLGLTLDASTVWEALPWTWLIDWGMNIGQYFAAKRNIIPCLPPFVHIMRHTQTTYTWAPKSFGTSPPGTFSGGVFTRDTKGRSNPVLTPTAHFPFLNGKQVGILASLAVTRR